MLKYPLLILILLAGFFSELSFAAALVSDYPSRAGGAEITGVVRGAIEDTRWLDAASRQEVQQLLAVYYCEPLLSELSDSVWNFISVPTDWDFDTRAGRSTILRQSDDQAAVLAEILETDVFSGFTFICSAEYHLVKRNETWKIIAVDSAP